MSFDGERFVRAYMHGLGENPPLLRVAQRMMVETVAENSGTIILGARQIGKTTAVAYIGTCLTLGIHPVTGARIPDDKFQIASKSKENAKDFIERATRMFEHASMGLARRQDALYDPRKSGGSRIYLTNKRQMLAHSGDPNAIQGFSGHVATDELGTGKFDPELAYTTALSLTSGIEGRRLIGIGNATKSHTWWHDMWESQEPLYVTRRHGLATRKITIHDAHPDGLPAYLLAIRDQLGGQESAGWRRWFLCEFVDGLDRALTEDEITGCEFADPDTSRGEVVIGVDPGGWPNPTGVCVVRQSKFGARVLHSAYWRTDPILGDEAKRDAWTQTQVARVIALMRQYRAGRVVVDHSALAAHVGSALERTLGEKTVQLVSTTTASRQRRWGYYLDLIRQGALYIPPESDALFSDMRAAEIDEGRAASGDSRARRQKVLEGGTLVLPQVPDDGHVLHCDVLDALLLTAEAAL